MNRRDSWQHRVRARRSRRGAAMVEALVAIPFFIIIFAASMFVGKFYNEKLRTISQSREKAWAAAEKDTCNGGGGGDSDVIDSSDLGMMSKSPLAALCDKGFGTASYTGRSTVTPSSVLGFGSKNLLFKTKLTCDETPQTGNFRGAVDFLWDYFGPPSGAPTSINILGNWFGIYAGAYGGLTLEPL